jgi:sialate O-acetylesterase
VFHPADSVWLHWQTNEMVVSSKEVPNPVAVRYCWQDFQLGTLHAGNYLPLIPFRSDAW